MEDIKVVKIFSTDDCVKMVGGKCKGCEGVIVKVMKLFCSVRLTKDKKGNPVFSDKPNKVKREHIVIIPPPPIEMPSSDDLKAVDDLEPHKNLLDEIDQKLINESKTEKVDTLMEEITSELKDARKQVSTLIEEVNTQTGEVNPNLVYDETPKHNATLIDEHGCSSELPTIDDAINLRDENQRLKLQVEALVSWQTHASAECAKYRKDHDDLKKRFNSLITLSKDMLNDFSSVYK